MDRLTQIGETFGSKIMGLVSGSLARSVVVSSIDAAVSVALVTIYGEGDPLPVPLSLLNIAGASFKVTPTVGSLAVVGFLNGDEDRPYFIAFAQIDKIEFARSSSKLVFVVDPDDSAKDKVTVSVGDSTVVITTGLIEMNGGGNDGTVLIRQLTQVLNGFVSTFNTHTHMLDPSGLPTLVPNSPASQFSQSDYENEKIRQ